MVAVLKEILVMPNMPTSLIGLLVEKLIGLLRDDTQKLQMVSLCVTIRLLKNQREIVSVYSSQIEHVFFSGCLYQWFPTQVLGTHCSAHFFFFMFSLFKTPDSDHQIFQRELYELNGVCQIR